MTTGYVSSRYTKSLLNLVNPEVHSRLLCEAGISEGSFQSDAAIAIENYNRLFKGVNGQLQSDVHSESEVEYICKYGAYQSILLLMVQSANLGEALERSHFVLSQLSPNGVRSSHVVGGDSVEWQFDLSIVADEPLWTVESFAKSQFGWFGGTTGQVIGLHVWHFLISWLIGRYITIDGVGLTGDAPEPKRCQRYQNLFEAPIEYMRTTSSLKFDACYLDAPIRQTHDSVVDLVNNFPLRLMQVSEFRRSVTARVAGLLGADFANPLPSIDEIARELNVSVSTLHRHLAAEKTTLQKIKDECRMQIAINYLADGQLSTEEMASELGFSEKSSFLRAFKRWTGMPPSAFRQSTLAKSSSR